MIWYKIPLTTHISSSHHQYSGKIQSQAVAVWADVKDIQVWWSAICHGQLSDFPATIPNNDAASHAQTFTDATFRAAGYDFYLFRNLVVILAPARNFLAYELLFNEASLLP